MKVARSGFMFHHMALAVHNLEESSRILSHCDYIPSPDYPALVIDEGLGVQLRFLTPRSGGPLLELVAGLGDASPVAKILEKTGVTLYHMCFEVLDLPTALSTLRKEGYVPVSKPMPAKAFNNRFIQFVYHNDSGLVELLTAL